MYESAIHVKEYQQAVHKAAVLLQLLPSLTAKEGLKKLEALIPILDPDFRYAIEVRHKSWFDRSVYKLLSENDICLAWSQLDTIQTSPELTSDFIYLRFIGDRSIDERRIRINFSISNNKRSK